MPVDLSGSIYAEYQKAIKRAEAAMKRGATHEAASAYRQCAELYRQYAVSSSDPAIRRQRLERADLYAETARRLDKGPTDTAAASLQQGRPPKSAVAVQASENSTSDDYESEVLNLLQQSHIRWEEIGGLEDTKRAIKLAYALALAPRPKAIKIPIWRTMLLFGPPGTGKTLLAAATAGNLEASFFNVKVSNLLSKYFGESSKLITALYAVARRNSPAVIFLDEFESLTPPRGSGESGAERRIVSTLLAELDGLATKDDDSFVLTMGATNVPWLLDDAILSRFQKRIYVPLPDEPARRAILEIHLIRRGYKLDIPLEELVKHSEGYSGREIEQFCQLAITNMIDRLNQDLIARVDKGLEAVRGGTELTVKPLNDLDFSWARKQVKPVASPDMLKRYSTWQKQVDQA
jgi:katanin p60 ATPase-containing subunit A1